MMAGIRPTRPEGGCETVSARTGQGRHKHSITRVVANAIALGISGALACFIGSSHAHPTYEEEYGSMGSCAALGASLAEDVWTWCYRNDKDNMNACKASRRSWVKQMEQNCNNRRRKTGCSPSSYDAVTWHVHGTERGQRLVLHSAPNRCDDGAGDEATKVSVGEGQATLDRDARRQIQSALAAQGFDPGQPDGVFGPRTRGAIEAWQQASGYAATGELTSKQAERLLAEETPVAPTGPAASGDLYGSIAFSQLTGGGYAFGIAWNEQGREAVRRSALEECRRQGGGDGCHEAGWFQNGCGAIAIGDGNGYGTGSGETSESAESGALSNCRSANRDCRVEASRCVGGDYKRSSPATARNEETTPRGDAQASASAGRTTGPGLRFQCETIDGRSGYEYLKWKSQTSLNQEYDADILRRLAKCQLDPQYDEVDTGLRNLRNASRKGDIHASQALGDYYRVGGVVQSQIEADYQESIRWYEDVLRKIRQIPDYPNNQLTSLTDNEIHFKMYPDTLLQLTHIYAGLYYYNGFSRYNERNPSKHTNSDLQTITQENQRLLERLERPLNRCLTDRKALQFESRARNLGVKEPKLEKYNKYQNMVREGLCPLYRALLDSARRMEDTIQNQAPSCAAAGSKSAAPCQEMDQEVSSFHQAVDEFWKQFGQIRDACDCS